MVSPQFINAQYKESQIIEYRDNPLIEALPDIWSGAQVIDLLKNQPHYHESDRELPAHIRLHLLQRVFELFIPLPVHTDLEALFSRIIRMGYKNRNPVLPGAWGDLKERLESLERCVKSGNLPVVQQKKGHSAGATIIGVSGMGKSTTISKILSQYPQVVVHSKYKDKKFTQAQVVYLHMECPGDGSPKALFLQFMREIDSILGTNYLKMYGGPRATTDSLLLDVARVAGLQQLGVLVIDEMQNLNAAKKGNAEVVLNFLVQLHNTIGIPVILVGTPQLQPLVSTLLRQSRRGAGQGAQPWNRLSKTDEEWDLFIEQLWKYQYIKNKIPFTDDLKNTLFDESQGITDFIIKIWVFAQADAILSSYLDGSEEEVTEKTLRNSARKGLSLCQPILEGLRSGNTELLNTVTDVYSFDGYLYTKDAEEQLRNAQSMNLIREKMQQDVTNPFRSNQIAAWLTQAGIGASKALESAQQACDELGIEVDEAMIKKRAFEIAALTKTKKNIQKPKKEKKKTSSSDTALLNPDKEGKESRKSNYDALKEAGLIGEYVLDEAIK